MKQISVGLLMTYKKTLLGCVPWGTMSQMGLDLPKGRMEAGEEPIETVVREVYEETSLHIDPQPLINHGLFAYNPKKDLFLFQWEMTEPLDLSKLHCIAQFENDKGQMVPEHVGYRVVPYSDIGSEFFPRLGKVIIQALGL